MWVSNFNLWSIVRWLSVNSGIGNKEKEWGGWWEGEESRWQSKESGWQRGESRWEYGESEWKCRKWGWECWKFEKCGKSGWECEESGWEYGYIITWQVFYKDFGGEDIPCYILKLKRKLISRNTSQQLLCRVEIASFLSTFNNVSPTFLLSNFSNISQKFFSDHWSIAIFVSI